VGELVVSDDNDALVGTPLAVLVAGPALMLLLAMLPAHALSAAGGIGRALGRGRVLLATMALAIWLGVFVSLLLGSAP
jgi:hypothetical protein